MTAFLCHYYDLVLAPGLPDRQLIVRYQKIAAGTDRAPDQYRLLVPKAVLFLTHLTLSALESVVIVSDGACLIIGGLYLARMLRRRPPGSILIALLYVSGFAVTVMLFPRPETFPAFLASTCLLGTYIRPGRAHAALGMAGGVVLAGCRPEMAIAAAVLFALRWHDRNVLMRLAFASVLVILGIAGVIIPRHLYPDTTYMTDLVQIRYNLDPRHLLIVTALLAPVFAFITRSGLRSSAPILAWVATQLTMIFIVGRVDEARILFPLSGALALVLADVYSAFRAEQGRSTEVASQIIQGDPLEAWPRK